MEKPVHYPRGMSEPAKSIVQGVREYKGVCVTVCVCVGVGNYFIKLLIIGK